MCKLKIIIILFLYLDSFDCERIDVLRFFINIVREDGRDPKVSICGGALISDRWVISNAKCVKRLYKKTKKLLITAGHRTDESPEQKGKVQTVRIPPGSDIALVKVKQPFKKSKKVAFAQLPTPNFKQCKNPVSVEFNQKGTRGSGFISGVIEFIENVIDFIKPRVKKSHSYEEYPKFYLTESGPKYLFLKKSKSKRRVPYSGWPLFCDDVVVGIQDKCKDPDKRKNGVTVCPRWHGELHPGFCYFYCFYSRIKKHMRFISYTLKKTEEKDKKLTKSTKSTNVASFLHGKNEKCAWKKFLFVSTIILFGVLC